MKRSLAVILVGALLAIAGQLLADLPGGNNLYSANITVKDQNGNGLAGVTVQLWVHTWYGEDETYDCFKNGVSGSGGTVYLECLIPAELSEGLLFMQVSMTDSRYTVISSQNTWSNYATRIYPVFNVGLDLDDNLIVDTWELPLAEKFCPTLILHTPLQEVSTEPTAIMIDEQPFNAGTTGTPIMVNKSLWVSVYDISGDYEGTFPAYQYGYLLNGSVFRTFGEFNFSDFREEFLSDGQKLYRRQ